MKILKRHIITGINQYTAISLSFCFLLNAFLFFTNLNFPNPYKELAIAVSIPTETLMHVNTRINFNTQNHFLNIQTLYFEKFTRNKYKTIKDVQELNYDFKPLIIKKAFLIAHFSTNT